MIEPTRSLSLSGLEVVFLSDSLRNGDTIKAKEDELACLEELLLNLGSAYVELVHPEGIDHGPVPLEVTKAQCWLMRAKVRTGDLAIDGKTNVGVSLLRKLYSLIIDLEDDVDVEVVAYESPPLTEQNVKDLKEAKYARLILDERYFQEP